MHAALERKASGHGGGGGGRGGGAGEPSGRGVQGVLVEVEVGARGSWN